MLVAAALLQGRSKQRRLLLLSNTAAMRLCTPCLRSCWDVPLADVCPSLGGPLQVDVWAVGVLAYELMMQGETPFYHDEPAETEKLILQVSCGAGRARRGGAPVPGGETLVVALEHKAAGLLACGRLDSAQPACSA